MRVKKSMCTIGLMWHKISEVLINSIYAQPPLFSICATAIMETSCGHFCLIFDRELKKKQLLSTNRTNYCFLQQFEGISLRIACMDTITIQQIRPGHRLEVNECVHKEKIKQIVTGCVDNTLHIAKNSISKQLWVTCINTNTLINRKLLHISCTKDTFGNKHSYQKQCACEENTAWTELELHHVNVGIKHHTAS